MISKESATAIAQALLEHEQRISHDRKNARARRVAWLYRYRELNRFEPWQREVIARRCAQLVNRELGLLLAMFHRWRVRRYVRAFLDFAGGRGGANAG